MQLHLLFRMVKTAALYLVSIKSYSKNTHSPFFEMSVSVAVRHANETALIGILLL